MSDRMQATQVKDDLSETKKGIICFDYIYSPGPLCYEVRVRQKNDGVYFVIKEQQASKPRKRIVVQIGNRLRFFEKIHDFMKFAEDNIKMSSSYKIQTAFDRGSYSEMKTGDGRRYRFKTFIEEYVPYLRICYIYEGRHHSLLFHVQGMEGLIRNIQKFSRYDPNRMNGEDNYDGCEKCAGFRRCLFGKPDSYKNKPIVMPSYIDFGQNNLSNLTNR